MSWVSVVCMLLYIYIYGKNQHFFLGSSAPSMVASTPGCSMGNIDNKTPPPKPGSYWSLGRSEQAPSPGKRRDTRLLLLRILGHLMSGSSVVTRHSYS